jgi:hypothetical protein
MPMANPRDPIFKASAMRKHRALADGERNHDPTHLRGKETPNEIQT